MIKKITIAFIVIIFMNINVSIFASYGGPINLKFIVQTYSRDANTYSLLRDGYIFVNTIKRPGSRLNDNLISNSFLKTNSMGIAEMTVSILAVGYSLTLYQVNPVNSTININCKLSMVDGSLTNKIIVPDIDSSNSIWYETVLDGQCII